MGWTALSDLGQWWLDVGEVVLPFHGAWSFVVVAYGSGLGSKSRRSASSGCGWSTHNTVKTGCGLSALVVVQLEAEIAVVWKAELITQGCGW